MDASEEGEFEDGRYSSLLKEPKEPKTDLHSQPLESQWIRKNMKSRVTIA